MKPAYNLFLLVVTLFSVALQAQINGVSFVAPSHVIGSEQVRLPKTKVNANFISIMPYGFIPKESTEIQFDTPWQWWGEKIIGTEETIRLAKAAGYKVMLKPHIWKEKGAFTGHHTYTKESDWKSFERSYSKYILRFAQLAEKHQVELFCVGTEWEKFALQRPNFWFGLIKEVKKVYHGKLTYAANWDEYQRISFWRELDYIGVDAYFPLVETKTPQSNEINAALLPYHENLKKVSIQHNKPILFTEFGYRSRDYTASKPWESDRSGNVNLNAQVNTYEGFFTRFWEEDFIVGGFLWKWFPDYDRVGGKDHNGFTPQNKPVEQTILKWFSLKE